MTLIRVEPERLRKSSSEQSALQHDAEEMACQVWGLTANAPSYDGQFGPAVSAIGAEGTARLQAMADRLGARAEYLAVKAAAFEAADAEAAEGLEAISSQVPEWLESGRHLLSDRGALESYNRYLALILLASRYLDGQPQEETPWWALILILLIRAGAFTFVQEPAGNLSERDQERLDFWQPRLEALADALYFGERSPMAPPEGVEGMLWLSGLTRDELLSMHQWQRDRTETTPNDCAVTAMAMVINMAREQLGSTGDPVQHGALAMLLDQAGVDSELGQRLRLLADGLQLGDIPGLIAGTGEGSGLTIPLRIPAGLQPGEGAMPPEGMEAALNWYAKEYMPEGSASWRAVASSGNDVNDLIRNLQEGNPTVIYGAWEQGGVPHTVVVAGYDPAGDKWQILDPGAGPSPQVSEWSTDYLESWWGRRYFAYPRYTMVVLEVPAPVAPVPERPPTPPAATETPATLTPTPPPIETPTPEQTGSP